jgi:hypothetical protein
MVALILTRHLQREGDVLGHRHVRIERVGLEHHGQLALGRRLAGDVAAIDVDGAAAGVLQAGDQPQQCRLAATRRADEDDELAILDHQVEPGDDGRRSEGLGDVLERDVSHGFLPEGLFLPIASGNSVISVTSPHRMSGRAPAASG